MRLDNLLVTDPRPRNPLLADAFKRVGIVERTARGIDAIFHAQLRGGCAVPSYERSTSTGVTLLLPGGRANLRFVRMRVEEQRNGQELGFQHLLLLNHLWMERTITSAATAKIIQQSQTEARRYLSRLVEHGWSSRGAEAEGHPISCRPPPIVDSVSSSSMCAYVAAYDRIARRDAAELCKVHPKQASRILA